MKTLNYGLIGCGMMGREHLSNLALLPATNVAAIFEPDAGMAAQAQAMAPGTKMVGSIAELLAVDALDALIIASPNHCHAAQLIQIAATRALPVLVEKPLFTDPADGPALAALGASYGAPIWVAMEYRYMPPIAALLDRVESATGGPLMLSIREHRFAFLDKVGNWNRFNRNSGGTLVEKCCHFFDLMRLILKAEPVRVMASAGQAVNHKGEIYDDTESDIWDSGYVLIDFDSGAKAMLELCMFADGSRYQEEFSVVGPTGKIEAFVPGAAQHWSPDLGDLPVPKVVLSPRDQSGFEVLETPVDPTILKAGSHNGSTFFEHQKFAAVLRGEGTVEVTLEDGAKAVAMGQAAQQSALTGQAVDM
ncbi:MAG: gfo/Idh/MocA family oxidoreductase [Rhodobacteraceae bacterium]|nr:gfo/Idh/MocA family oxidoreductase [Paracoccaceae bacterium]